MGVIAALGLFASIVLHELAHSLVARRYGVPIRGITLFIFGGVAHMDREPDRPGAEFAVAIAGPIASALIAVACWILLRGALAAGAGVPVVGVLAYLASINAMLAVFNLVPAFPLDGGRILRAGCGPGTAACAGRPASPHGSAERSASCSSRSGCGRPCPAISWAACGTP